MEVKCNNKSLIYIYNISYEEVSDIVVYINRAILEGEVKEIKEFHLIIDPLKKLELLINPNIFSEDNQYTLNVTFFFSFANKKEKIIENMQLEDFLKMTTKMKFLYSQGVNKMSLYRDIFEEYM